MELIVPLIYLDSGFDPICNLERDTGITQLVSEITANPFLVKTESFNLYAKDVFSTVGEVRLLPTTTSIWFTPLDAIKPDVLGKNPLIKISIRFVNAESLTLRILGYAVDAGT